MLPIFFTLIFHLQVLWLVFYLGARKCQRILSSWPRCFTYGCIKVDFCYAYNKDRTMLGTYREHLCVFILQGFGGGGGRGGPKPVDNSVKAEKEDDGVQRMAKLDGLLELAL